ncbi:THO complex subunit 1 isoform X2 [Nilaparvata lugens]|uniref:THO complex subunit 1 isoform X1 n=1 Tax=Nilaparvata lugens TaxID=108931 RepID=UPI00193C9FD6|nr:THO complex subunit 1 isoform X1 [Nilaparvata lugens]XP_039284402.1 THO complex subunit 1 isoform X2 [Nilaparvata lugens]
MASKHCSFELMRSQLQESLKSCSEKKNLEPLKKSFDSLNTSDSEKRSALDQVLRDYLLVLFSASASDSDDRISWEGYLQLCIEACRKDMATTTMPVVLLGDIFDALTLDKCERLFTFVEDNVSIWKEDLFFSACKNNLLRMCNDLLRRLSRSQNTVFCGRILLFLAKFFPFSERSGLNIVSDFNVENVTEFGSDEPMDTKDADDKSEDDDSPDKIKIDYNLYTKFWKLQDFFCNPNLCYNKVQWKLFSSHTSCVLSAFKSFKLYDEGKRSNQVVNVDEPLSEHYFAKFLTNQKLLELQLSDVSFRRYVLLQFLILFQYLNSRVKFKADTFELKSDQTEWVTETTQLIYTLLQETPPDGVKFSTTVKNILQREEFWNSWKNEGCPELQRPSAPADDDAVTTSEVKRRSVGCQPQQKRPHKRLGQIIKDATAHKKFVFGNPELNKLWNHMPDNLEACRSKDRDFLPSLESYFEEAIEQTNPAAMLEEEYKKVNDCNFGWRALRLLARRSPYFFSQSNILIAKMPDFLENMILRISKDKPTESAEVKMELTEVKQEIQEDMHTIEVNDGDTEDEELMKTDEKKEEVTATHNDSSKLMKSLVPELVPLIPLENWKKLAIKLGFADNTIDYFEGMSLGRRKEHQTDCIKEMLKYWCETDDCSIENLTYTLEGLEFTEAVEFLKPHHPNPPTD